MKTTSKVMLSMSAVTAAGTIVASIIGPTIDSLPPGRVWLESSSPSSTGEMLAIARHLRDARAEKPRWNARRPPVKWHPARVDQVGEMPAKFATTEVTRPIRHPTDASRWAMPIDEPGDVYEVKRILSCGFLFFRSARCAKLSGMRLTAIHDPSWVESPVGVDPTVIPVPPDDEDGGAPF